MSKHKLPDGSEVYWDGAHYDADNASIQTDIPFYIKEAKKAGGPVLELACGTGRLTIPIALAGVDITGVDISQPMLLRAREKAVKAGVKAGFIKADIRFFRLKKKFKLIFIPFNSMQHLHDRVSLERFFERVRAHLSPGGRFIVDVFNPNPHYLVRDPDELIPIGHYKDPLTGRDILVNESYSYDRAAQAARLGWHYKRGRCNIGVKKLNMRCFFPLELEMLLHYNGFAIKAKYGDFDRSAFRSGSPKQILVCLAR
ncbi:MAG TPA: class I SAM-dependent methyltransferase [Elusimicrobia bacterium]|nr:class I SAM-dependent methyltransferase [Elusimicrobiota bacterium]